MDVCRWARSPPATTLQGAAVGQPHAVDTICTLCGGCNTTAWIKASRSGRGAQLIRMTPRLNESEQLLDVRHRSFRLSLDRRRPSRPAAGAASRRSSSAVGGCAGGGGGRRRGRRRRRGAAVDLGHASLGAASSSIRHVDGGVTISWRRRSRSGAGEVQIPPVDAPNVRGARSASTSASRASRRRRRCAMPWPPVR